MADDIKSVLEAVASSQRLRDFLDLVAADLKVDAPDDTSALIAFWETHQGVFEGDDVVTEFSRFLRDNMPEVLHEHCQPEKASCDKSRPANVEQPSKEYEEARRLTRRALEAYDEQLKQEQKLFETSLSRYDNFTAFFTLAPYWPEYNRLFDRLDPGEALSNIFGQHYASDITVSAEFSNERALVSDASLSYELILAISEFVKTHATAEQEAILDRIVKQPRSGTEPQSVPVEKIEFFRKASKTTHVLFEAYSVPFFPTTSDELEILFRLPFAIDPAEHGQPHCTFQLVAWASPSGDDPDRNESRSNGYREAVRQVSRRMREARRREYGGKSPYSPLVAHDILSTISSAADVQIMHGALREIREVVDADEPLLWSPLVGVGGYELSDSNDFELLAAIVDDYLTIADSLAQDSNIEASQYLLSFVVFRLVKTMEGNLEPFPELFRLLNNASNALHHSSGAEALSRAVSFAAEEAESGGESITAHKLRQLYAGSRLEILIGQGESETVEFKSTLRVNLRSGAKDDKIKHEALKTMAAFFNTKGGSLIIGIGDTGETVGLAQDKFSSSDKWQRHLVDIVGSNLTGLLPGQWSVSMHRRDGEDVAVVECQKSTMPVFVSESNEDQFFVRVANTTSKLGLREAFEYKDKHFKQH